ncbi:hypothetical protein K431DRAFT_293193 [Polychaeton citri CBS 116435]|uniref:Uncharacterized protein n=1 Tax=Polychaeton citri CBS 116435 TaxID=1314669 RepID=A0A9P4QDU3_9PEZI|nr:hypothetical protein K431DRAFT_293193 [Polychaeton citri CBS 116435]
MQQQLQLQTHAPPAWDGLRHINNPAAPNGSGVGGTQGIQLPSPTLTNPDMVLPTEGSTYGIASPPNSKKGSFVLSQASSRNETIRGANGTPSIASLRGGGLEFDRDEVRSRNSITKPADKRGLMSRKMMLARSQSSQYSTGGAIQQDERGQQGDQFRDFDGAYDHAQTNGTANALPSSPTVDNASTGFLAPAAVAEKRVSSGSSYNSDDLKAAQQFLSKYPPNSGDATDDESVVGREDGLRRRSGEVGFSSAASIAENDLDSRRREQKIEEMNSVMLSQRAEQILANAKKRLNLMEGNLRGARDLVAPLTAANLKRATSLGSSNLTPIQMNARSRFTPEGYRQDTAIPNALPPHTRVLHSQASSPTIGRDYRTGYNYTGVHARGFSETEVPGRTTPTLSRQSSFARNGRFPVKVSEGDVDTNKVLRNSRSYDTLPNRFSYQRPPSRERGLQKNSPDSNLDPLPEDDGYGHQAHPLPGHTAQAEYGLGLYGPQSAVEEGPFGGRTLWRSQSIADDMRGYPDHQHSQHPQPFVSSYRQYWHQRQHTETFRSASSAADYRQPSAYGFSPEPLMRSPSAAGDLRSQMNSLKGRISSLRDRAREDSLRRRSVQSLRTPSPLNNAAQDAPEMFYMQSENYGSPVRDTNAGYGWSSNDNTQLQQTGSKSSNASHDRASEHDRNAYSAPLTQGHWTGNDASRQLHQQQGVDWRDDASASPTRPSTARYQPQGQEGELIIYDGDFPLRASNDQSEYTSEQHRRYPAQHQRNESGDSHDSYDEYEAAEDEQADEVVTVDDTPPEYVEEGDEFEVDRTINDAESASIYEDAPSSPSKDVIAHEDRADAFDYKQFFIHNAMAVYGNRERSDSHSTEQSDASSTETARAPEQVDNTADVNDDEDYGDEENDFFDPDATPRRFPPPTPETPEQLREIERRNLALLHQRTLSNDSVSTINSFATAAEAREMSPSPAMMLRKAATGGAALKADADRRRRSPVLAPGRKAAISQHDNEDEVSPDRADSGVGFTGRKGRLSQALAAAATAATSLPQDPVTVAVNALLRPDKGALGLRDKAMVFEVVEALRKVVGGMQDQGQGNQNGAAVGLDELRERLTRGRNALEGAGSSGNAGGRVIGRPGTA